MLITQGTSLVPPLVKFYDYAGVTNVQLEPLSTNNDSKLILGVDNGARGWLALWSDQTSAPTRPALLSLDDQNEDYNAPGPHKHYFWVYDTGTGNPRYELRVLNAADPGAGTGGTKIASWN